MNVTAIMMHTCDIVRNNVLVSDTSNKDAYGQPRTIPAATLEAAGTPVYASVPCVFESNISRALFTTDVLKSAGSVLATLLIDCNSILEDIHLGDIFTNIQDKRGNQVSTKLWFSYRISKFADDMGAEYFQVMVAFDEAGPRN